MLIFLDSYVSESSGRWWELLSGTEEFGIQLFRNSTILVKNQRKSLFIDVPEPILTLQQKALLTGLTNVKIMFSCKCTIKYVYA